MNIRFQYNKTSLQQLNKQLNIRLRALPTLKNKESALRVEVKKAKNRTLELEMELENLIKGQDDNLGMWMEFESDLLSIRDIEHSVKKIAGVRTPELKNLTFNIKEFDVFLKTKWFLDGIQVLEKMISLLVEKDIAQKKMEMLEYARKKTTQKVNLYEKVQVPAYQESILKIKRYLEDEENLTKAAQKIVKSRQQKAEESRI
jgi:V/A-type H+-transporting ATPase subunit D